MSSARKHFVNQGRVSGFKLAGGLTLALLASVATASMANASVVTFNPAAAGLSSQGAFTADNYSLSDFATASINNTTGAFVETGTLQLNTFLLGSSTISSATSGLRNGTGSASYGLYVTFTASGTIAGFNPALIGITSMSGTFSSVSYTLYGDPGNSNSVSSAGVLSDLGNADIVLATGGLAGSINTVEILASGVPSADVLLTLLKTSTGDQFFELPLNLSVQEDVFSNTRSVTTFTVTPSTTTLVINGGGGNGTLEAVPEPASLSLFGVGLIGLGAVVRRRRRAA